MNVLVFVALIFTRWGGACVCEGFEELFVCWSRRNTCIYVVVPCRSSVKVIFCPYWVNEAHWRTLKPWCELVEVITFNRRYGWRDQKGMHWSPPHSRCLLWLSYLRNNETLLRSLWSNFSNHCSPILLRSADTAAKLPLFLQRCLLFVVVPILRCCIFS